MPGPRRDRLRLYADILEAVRRGAREGRGPPVTRVQLEVNAPTARFREYLDDLRARGLLVGGPELKLTAEGQRFLEEYRDVESFLERFGFGGGGRNHRGR